MKFQAFLINMKKSIDRYEFMSRQLEKLCIDFTLQEGIEYAKYSQGEDYEEVRSDLDTREKGISLSHKRIMEKIIEKNLDFALIMEDDIDLPSNFKVIIQQEMERREANITRWDYLSFNYPTVGLHFVKLWFFLLSTKFKRKRTFFSYLKLPIYFIKFVLILMLSIFERVREILYKRIYTYGKPALFLRPLYLAGCYLITKEGARKLLSLSNPITYTADRLPNAARVKAGLKFYAFVPLIVKQRRDKFWDAVTEDDKRNFFNN